jgi:hypothetical protein
MMRRTTLAATLAAFSLLAGACAGADAADLDADEPVSATPDDGTAVDPDQASDEFPSEDARQEARGLLGMHEHDLETDVRVARRGDESYMLTEDYVLGRRTVELDDDGSGFRVMSVTVELPDGPEEFFLEAN